MKLQLSSPKIAISIGVSEQITLEDFEAVVLGKSRVEITPSTFTKLDRVRRFINHILKENIKIYGITTGFADLRSCSVCPEQASLLSSNIILSHDAGIGKNMENDVVLGAMLLRAHSLARGYSGFQKESLITLVDMINHRIIPRIPMYGSLGASGDLAYLARLARAMQGHDVAVFYEGQEMSAAEALSKAKIAPFVPSAKEGLALTNGTSFMASMMALAWIKQTRQMNNLLSLLTLFLSSTRHVDAAFMEAIQEVRGQKGQIEMARRLRSSLKDSPFTDKTGVQQDYCIRCLPQILGSKFEIIYEQYPKMLAELNAVTDNPLIFEGVEVSSDIGAERIIQFEGTRWAVLSGGNFHGEQLTTIADTITAANAKIILTLERGLTYLLNPYRNEGVLPTYLIADQKNRGLLSGFMITQYTANALAQKIATLALPSQMFNITSANESEDVVSYGATACQRLLEQLDTMHLFNSIYLTVNAQAYALSRRQLLEKGISLSENLYSEKVYAHVQAKFNHIFPIIVETSFEDHYRKAGELLSTELHHTVRDYIAK